jgi:hypothetical protein
VFAWFEQGGAPGRGFVPLAGCCMVPVVNVVVGVGPVGVVLAGAVGRIPDVTVGKIVVMIFDVVGVGPVGFVLAALEETNSYISDRKP